MDHPVAGELEVGVGLGVSLAVQAGAVVREAVELHDEAMLGPEGIDLVGAELSI